MDYPVDEKGLIQSQESEKKSCDGAQSGAGAVPF
jgi:hypothetical protein